jgi:zinc protease
MAFARFLYMIFFLSHPFSLSAFETPLRVKSNVDQSPIQIQEITFETGHNAWVVNTPHLDLVSIGLCFQYKGDMACPKGKKGLTALYAALLDEGAGPLDGHTFKKKLAEYAIDLTLQAQQDNLLIVMRFPTASTEEAFRCLQLILTSPSFNEKDVQRLKQQIIAGLKQSQHHPSVRAKQKAFSIVWGDDHPYVATAEQKIADLQTVTSGDLKAFHTQAITQAHLKIAAAGNVDDALLKQYLYPLIKELPKGIPDSQKILSDFNNLGSVTFEEMNVPQTSIIFMHPGIPRQDPDFYAAFILMSALGNGALESRLFNEVREKRGLAYGIDAHLFSSALTYGILGQTATKTESVSTVMQLIKNEWKKVADNGITAEELALHKQNITGSYPLTFNKTTSIVRVLLSYQCEGLPKNYMNDRNHYFEKVTLADIKRVAKRLLNPEKLTYVVVGKPYAK